MNLANLYPDASIISEKFSNFCGNLAINSQSVKEIEDRAKVITKRINLDFWNSDSETDHRVFVGSYGRDTDIHVSDVDIILQLPYPTYQQFNAYKSGAQSALIQATKTAIQKTYSKTYIRGDGQVVKINFTDGINFEIVPAFIHNDGLTYTYPDTNNGGAWKMTYPLHEINAIRTANVNFASNLKRLCRMARAWKDTWNVPISGLLIDTLAYYFMSNWEHRQSSFVFYDWMTRDFLEFVKNQPSEWNVWYAPGSRDHVWRTGTFEYKAKQCYNLAIEAIEFEGKNMQYSANQKWKEIYGAKFSA